VAGCGTAAAVLNTAAKAQTIGVFVAVWPPPSPTLTPLRPLPADAMPKRSLEKDLETLGIIVSHFRI
jgi:hypothetical protein